MIELAENSLRNHKYLEKVIVLEHHMRFDHEENSNLAILANRTLSGLASKSRLRHHIYVGRHSFYSHGIGITHEKRF